MIFVVEFFSDSGDLSEFELREAQTAPSFGGSDERAEHELEHRLLAEAIGNDFQPPPFFDEQPFEEVRRLAKRRCVTGRRRCAMQASKSSSKQASALGRTLA
jgi:hypothetical protein